jgi:uncharacterized damage-inducible protein DinB
MNPVLTTEEILRWWTITSDNWRRLLSEHPQLLTVPCDVAGTKSLAELLQHIVAVELRYAERLADLHPSDYASIPFDSVDAIFATHDRAARLFERLLASDIDWDQRIDFVTRTMGPASASRRFVLFHAMLHAVRHYAQLATLARHQGVKPDWPMDILFLDLERVDPERVAQEHTGPRP